MTLVIAALFSVIPFSVIPLILLIIYLYLWWRPRRPIIHLILDYFNFFALAVLFSQWLGQYSFLIALPLLLLLHDSLQKTAMSFYCRQPAPPRQLTGISIFLSTVTGIILLTALLLGNRALILVSVCAVAYLITLQTMVRRHIPPQPVTAPPTEQRMVAGNTATVHTRLRVKTAWGGNLLLQSPYSWLKINPDFIALRDTENIDVDVTLTPPLAGPSEIKLTAYVTDRWGMLQFCYEIILIKLYVIPRARYAAWLARKYLEGTAPGTLPLVSALRPSQLQHAPRGGVEYYGNRPYQAGDNLKNIDWKHSLKFNEMVSKDFREFHGQAALTLINLSVANAEEGDKLAFNIITAALSLARENIPSVLAAYNHEQVTAVSTLLARQSLVTQALQIAQDIIYLNDSKRYLASPDIARLRANLARINSSTSNAAAVLEQLLRMEYRNFSRNARKNPATEALLRGSFRAGREFSIIVISRHNHDADALAFHTFAYRQQGHAIIEIA